MKMMVRSVFYNALEVVEEIENEDTQILLAEAKEERKDISV